MKYKLPIALPIYEAKVIYIEPYTPKSENDSCFFLLYFFKLFC